MLDPVKLSSIIGELTDEDVVDMENHIDNYIKNYCTLNDDIKKLLCMLQKNHILWL